MHHVNVFLTSLLNLTLSPCFLDDFPTSLNRWCGPMQAAILHSQNMPRPQFRPQWATNQSGPYMMGRTMNPIPSMTQGTWSGHRFPPAPRFHCYILPQGTYKSLTTSRAVVAQNGLGAAGCVCVKHLNRCKTSTFQLTFQDFAGIIQGVGNEPVWTLYDGKNDKSNSIHDAGHLVRSSVSTSTSISLLYPASGNL